MRNFLFPVNECFTSIQGEGNQAGMLSFFIRFQFCNIRCSWCDTHYTWDESDAVEYLSAKQLAEKITESGVANVILTGGEPLLYPIDFLYNENSEVTYHIETNGTLAPDLPLETTFHGKSFSRDRLSSEFLKNARWVISPKISFYDEYKTSLPHYHSLPHHIFKFILEGARSANGVDKTIDKAIFEVKQFCLEHQIPKNRVYLGFEGTSIESQLSPKGVEKVIELGYHYSPRLHVWLWGNQRKK